MIKTLRISRFKSVREVSLEFGRVNLFIGGNGTGKSNILEALGLVSVCLGRSLGDADIGEKGLRITPPELMKSSFKSEDLPKTLELTAGFADDVVYRVRLSSRENDPLLRFFSESCKMRGESIFGRSHAGVTVRGRSVKSALGSTRGLWDQFRAGFEFPESVENAFQAFLRYAIYAPQTDVLRGRQAGRLNTPPVGLHGEGLPEAVKYMIKQSGKLRKQASRKAAGDATRAKYGNLEECFGLVWLPGWAKRVEVSRLDGLLLSRELVDRDKEMLYFVDKYMHARRNTLSVYDSSEGTLFLLFSAVLLAHEQSPRIFSLDNVDNALNPLLTKRLLQRVIDTVKTSAKYPADDICANQVFLTSHNPTALDAFDLFDDDQRVFVVRRDGAGRTSAVRLAPEPSMTREEWELGKAGRNLSQLWLDGEIFGALGEV